MFAVIIGPNLNGSLTAQTVIKEKVTLEKPKKKSGGYGNSITSNTITFLLNWTTSQREANVKYERPCLEDGESGWQNGGEITVTINNANGGNYTFWFAVGADINEDPSASYTIRLNGETVKSGFVENARWNGTAYTENVNYSTPYFSVLSLGIYDDALCPQDSTALTVSASNDCASENIWTPATDVITLSIVEGNQYASFTDLRTGESGLQTVELLMEEFINSSGGNNIFLKPKTSGTGETIVIRAEAGGLYDERNVNIHGGTYEMTIAGNDTVYSKEKENLYIFANYTGICGNIPLPEDVTFDVSIINGAEYGVLINPATGERGTQITGLTHNGGSAFLYYEADGEDPPDLGGSVTVKAESSSPDLASEEKSFLVVPQALIVKFGNEKLSPGDTTEIFLYMRGSEGSEDPFPNGEYQEFTLKLLEGYQYADIIVPNDTTGYDTLENKTEPFKLTANEEIDLDSVRIKLYVETMIEDFGYPASPAKNKSPEELKALNLENKGVNKKKENTIIDEKEKQKRKGKTKSDGNDIAIMVIPGFGYPIWGTAEIDVIKEPETIEILLGETKYFQAKQNNATQELKIVEIEPDNNGIPQQNTGDAGDGWTWLTEDVWGNEPLEIIDCDSCGSKMGVYWENKYPVWGNHKYRGNEYLGRVFNGMTSLSNGLIRVIGRYWTSDSTYIVKLKTKSISGNSDSANIKVIKPVKLVSDKENATPYGSYSKTKDVFDETVNIDSLCIYYGGLIGISPQFIKGQIHKETDKTNFQGIGYGFAPSYRFEPYTTQRKKEVLEGMKNNPFYITATTNINPPEHQHLKPMSYFSGDTITVWQIICDYSQIINKSNPNLYGDKTNVDTMDFDIVGYESTDLQETYHDFFEKTKTITIKDNNGKERKLTFAERADTTNKLMIKYLRDEFQFYDKDGTKGMKNMIAQTRIASSYGLFQAMYTTAIGDDWNYPEDIDSKPEYLNEIDTNFNIASKMYTKYLVKGLKGKVESNNWTVGYEEVVRRYIFKKWNGDSYSKLAISRSQLFLPQK